MKFSLNNGRLYIDDKIVVIRGRTDFILNLEKNKYIELIVVDNSDFISLYLINILKPDIFEDKKIKKKLFDDIKELNN